jgi:hypothetical protein
VRTGFSSGAVAAAGFGGVPYITSTVFEFGTNPTLNAILLESLLTVIVG